jgi:PAS domain S-box-containing protein
MSQDSPSGGNGFLPSLRPRGALTDAPAGEPFDRLARLAATVLHAPAALLAVLHEGRALPKGAFGLPPSLAVSGDVLAQRLAAAAEPLAVANIAEDPRIAQDPLVTEAEAAALLAVPLGPPGHLVALLAVLDFRPRTWSREESQLLADLGLSILAELDVFRLREEAGLRLAEVERERREKATLLAGIPEGVLLLDPQGRITLLNPEAAQFLRRVSGRSPAELIGRNLWEACPEVADSVFSRECHQAETEGRPFRLETYFPGPQRWVAFHGTPSGEGLCLTLQDITETTRLERSLHRHAEELAEAGQGQDEFLTALAHQVRDALVPIRTALHLWAERGPAWAEGEEARAMAEREVQHLTHLLENLLAVSQLAAGNLRPRPERVDLGELVGTALRTALASPEIRGHRLLLELPPEALPIEGDPALLQQVLAQLLENAAKFTPSGGEIRLGAGREGDEVVVRVRDNGIGIEAEDLPRVFDLFMRAGRPQGRLRAGLGVGLTLVRRLVELHGGSVEAHSEGPDRGSEFVVRLPAPEAAAPPSSAGASGPEREGGHVLIVDNSKEAADSIAVLLRTWGYEVRVAYDPFAALEEARARPPAVVLLDIGMPGMDGYEVARRLRGQTKLRGAVLVAVTGYSEEQDRQKAQAAGFDYHMVKPVDPNDLRALMELAATSAKPSLRAP